jgi:4'-phosphopantetheinyl transferase
MSIGCDVETVEDRDGTFVDDFFTAEEAAFVRSVEPPARPLAATLIWSAKESSLKVSKKGLSRDTRSVTVRVWDPSLRANAEGWDRLEVECLEPASGFWGWWRTESGKVFTIVVDGAPIGCEPRRLI